MMKNMHWAIIVQLKNYVLDVDSPMEPSKEVFEDAMVDIKEESYQPNEFIPKIYFNALYGFTSPQTMKVKRYFKG